VIKKNDQIWVAPDDGEVFTRICATDTRRPEYQRLQEKARKVFSRMSLTDNRSKKQQAEASKAIDNPNIRGASSMKAYVDAGFKPMIGFQIRYIYFLDPAYRARLTVPELPYSEIEKRGASMYLGHKRGEGETDNAAQSNVQTEGARPISPLLKATE
jgi:hypothetical protein